MNILIALNVLLILLVAGLFLSAVVIFRRVSATVSAFLQPTGENQPSPLATSVDAFSVIFARSITTSLRAMLMGMQSGVVRSEKAVEGDIAEGVAENGSPILAAAMQAFPALRKTIRRNPGLVDLALSRLGGSLVGHKDRQPGNGQSKFKFGL